MMSYKTGSDEQVACDEARKIIVSPLLPDESTIATLVCYNVQDADMYRATDLHQSMVFRFV